MLPLIQEQTEALTDLCRRYGVRRLDVFGSAAGDAHDASPDDLDFLVDFGDMDPGAYAQAYFGLLEDLHRLFEMRIDLVADSAITNPYFRESVNRTRMQLYAA